MSEKYVDPKQNLALFFSKLKLRTPKFRMETLAL